MLVTIPKPNKQNIVNMSSKRILMALAAAAALLSLTGCKQKSAPGIIKTEIPARPAGVEDMILFAADPIPDVGIGVVGLGMRGSDAVERLSFVPGCHVAAVCDLLPERADASLQYSLLHGVSNSLSVLFSIQKTSVPSLQSLRVRDSQRLSAVATQRDAHLSPGRFPCFFS